MLEAITSEYLVVHPGYVSRHKRRRDPRSWEVIPSHEGSAVVTSSDPRHNPRNPVTTHRTVDDGVHALRPITKQSQQILTGQLRQPVFDGGGTGKRYIHRGTGHMTDELVTVHGSTSTIR